MFLFSCVHLYDYFFFFSSRRRHTRFSRDWSSDVCSSDLAARPCAGDVAVGLGRRRPGLIQSRRLPTNIRLMPTGLVIGVRGQVSTGAEELVVEVDVEMLRL